MKRTLPIIAGLSSMASGALIIPELGFKVYAGIVLMLAAWELFMWNH